VALAAGLSFQDARTHLLNRATGKKTAAGLNLAGEDSGAKLKSKPKSRLSHEPIPISHNAGKHPIRTALSVFSVNLDLHRFPRYRRLSSAPSADETPPPIPVGARKSPPPPAETQETAARDISLKEQTSMELHRKCIMSDMIDHHRSRPANLKADS
jgi:hypothetical protein